MGAYEPQPARPGRSRRPFRVVRADVAATTGKAATAGGTGTAAARMLCAGGTSGGTDLSGAIYAYHADPLVMPTWGGDPLWLLGFRVGEVGRTRRLTVLG